MTMTFTVVSILIVVLMELIFPLGLKRVSIILNLLISGTYLIGIFLIFLKLISIFPILLLLFFLPFLLNYCSIATKELRVLILSRVGLTLCWVFLIRIKLGLGMLNSTFTDHFSRNYLSKVLNFHLILIFQHLLCCQSRVFIFSQAFINECPKYRIQFSWIFL